jgi:pimeloyl-ACP methyl ester carboxylesterase
VAELAESGGPAEPVAAPDPAAGAPAASAAVSLELVAGPADAPAIVFIHGTRMSRSYWTPQVAALSDEFRTIAVDLPGHGVRGHESFTLDGAVAGIAAAVEDRAGGRAIVVGLSLGGYVAMALAADRPELVRGLVVSGATIEPAGRLRNAVLALAVALDLGQIKWADPVSARYYRVRYPAAIAEPVIAGGFWSAGGAIALRALAGERFKPRLAAYPGPVLLINGSQDFVMRPGARGFAAAAKDVRRVRIRGASHLVNLDRPAAFNDAIRRFARSLDGR